MDGRGVATGGTVELEEEVYVGPELGRNVGLEVSKAATGLSFGMYFGKIVGLSVARAETGGGETISVGITV
jgi:hypothetical protein